MSINTNEDPIDLGPEDAVVIIRQDGRIEIRVPKREDHENMPDVGIMASVVANLLTKDSETMEIATNNFFASLAEFKKSREANG